MEEENKHIDELIANYLTEGLDKNALDELKTWIAASAENQQYFIRQREIWFSAVSREAASVYDKDKAFENFRNRVESQKEIQSTSRRQQRETADFTSIEISRGIDVAIVRGEMEPITVEADDNLFSYIKTTVKNKVLKIYIPDSVNIVKYASMNVLISMPTLGSLKASNHSRIDAWPQIWNLRTIRLEATTGGQIRIRLKAEDIQAEARTSGILEIKGEAQNLQAILKTAARLEARELETQNADIQLSIGAKAEIQVNQRLTYDLYGHSRLVIKGNPQIENSHNYSGSRIIKEK